MAMFETPGASDRNGSNNGSHAGMAAKVFIAGATVGAITAILMTPRRGSEVRYTLRRGAKSSADKSRQLLQSRKDMAMAKQTAEQAVGAGKSNESESRQE
jgi:gas vesicle protein